MGTLRDKYHKFGGSLQALKSTLEILEGKIAGLPQEQKGEMQRIHHVLTETLSRIETQAEDLKGISYRFINPDLTIEEVFRRIKAENATKKILAVEDDETLGEILPGFLQKYGYPFMIVSDAKKAKEALVNEKPDVIIFDLVLGETLGGLDILKFIKDRHIDVRSIVQSRIDDEEIIKSVEALGPDKILFKPFSLKELGTQINGLLAKAKG